MVKLWLHAEGVAFFVVALYLYNLIGGNWLLFVLLLFAPDISMIGYAKNSHMGALVYNLLHNFVVPLGVIGIGIFLPNNLVLAIGIILFAHVSIDRAFGYGLKYSTNFKDTHYQRV